MRETVLNANEFEARREKEKKCKWCSAWRGMRGSQRRALGEKDKAMDCDFPLKEKLRGASEDSID